MGKRKRARQNVAKNRAAATAGRVIAESARRQSTFAGPVKVVIGCNGGGGGSRGGGGVGGGDR